MPGKLTEVAIQVGTTAKEAFALAEVDTSGYELRLDGEVIDEDVVINGHNLLVAMKKIKGNTWENISPLENKVLPLYVKEVKELDDIVVLDDKYIISKEDFEKIYFELEEHTCTCNECTCEEVDEYDVAIVKDALEDVQSAIGKLSIIALKLETVLENK